MNVSWIWSHWLIILTDEIIPWLSIVASYMKPWWNSPMTFNRICCDFHHSPWWTGELHGKMLQAMNVLSLLGALLGIYLISRTKRGHRVPGSILGWRSRFIWEKKVANLDFGMIFLGGFFWGWIFWDDFFGMMFGMILGWFFWDDVWDDFWDDFWMMFGMMFGMVSWRSYGDSNPKKDKNRSRNFGACLL